MAAHTDGATNLDIRTSVNVSVLAVVAGIAGALNQAVQARAFGSSVQIAVYFGMLSTVQIVTGMAPGVLSNVLVPQFATGVRRNESRLRAAWAAIASLALLCSTWGIVAAGLQGRALTANLDVSLQAAAETTGRVLWLWAGFALVASFLAALHQSNGRFVRVSLFALAPSLCSAAFGLVWGRRLGIMSMALGLVAASIFQIVALAWTLPCRLGLPRFGDLDIRETLRLGSKAVPVILSLLPATAAPAIVIAAAVRINPASAAHLGYCSSFATLCSVAIGSGLGIVALRSVAEQHATGGVAQVRAMADARIRYVLLLGSLTTVALWSGRQEVIRLLFQRGNFDPGAAAGVANLLPWYLLVSICAACQTVLRSLFNATGRYSIPALLGMAMTVVLYVSVLLCRSNVTVAMAYAGASVLYAMAAIAFVGVPDLLALAAFAARVTATAAFSIVASVLFRRALPAADGLAMSVFVGGAAAGFGCAVFALTGGFVTGLEEVRRVFACRARVWQLAVGSSR